MEECLKHNIYAKYLTLFQDFTLIGLSWYHVSVWRYQPLCGRFLVVYVSAWYFLIIKVIMSSCMFLHLIFFNVNYWFNTSPFTFPLSSQYQDLIVPFFLHINIELSYGDNCLLFLLASLRPVSSRPWPIFSETRWAGVVEKTSFRSCDLDEGRSSSFTTWKNFPMPKVYVGQKWKEKLV